jgi:predicted AlkP superfamily pyrophosphatase or phosphodiesterase
MVKTKIGFFHTYLVSVYRKGFRHGYLNTYSLPTFTRIQNEGIKTTHGMQPTFVTMTFPNHISIATG